MISPRSKYILVEPLKENTKTKSGLLIPSSVEQEQRAIATVIAVGKEIGDIKKGDKIIHGAFAGDKIKMSKGGKVVDYILLHDDDVIAFYEV
jgi:co-chaperonin GroES (HSP10)